MRATLPALAAVAALAAVPATALAAAPGRSCTSAKQGHRLVASTNLSCATARTVQRAADAKGAPATLTVKVNGRTRTFTKSGRSSKGYTYESGSVWMRASI